MGYASENKTIDVFVTASESPFTRYFSQTVELQQEPQDFSLSFTMTDSDVVELEFNFIDIDGGQAAIIFLDNVSLSLEECEPFDPCMEEIMVTNPISPGYHQADRTLTSDAVIASPMNIIYQANEAIELLPTFEITPGAVLTIDMSPCNID